MCRVRRFSIGGAPATALRHNCAAKKGAPGRPRGRPGYGDRVARARRATIAHFVYSIRSAVMTTFSVLKTKKFVEMLSSV